MRLTWLFLAVLPLSVGAQTVDGTFSFETDLRATLSAPLAPFWDEYPQYAATTAPMATLTAGLVDPGRWEVAADIVLKQQFAGWRSTNLTLPVEGPQVNPVEYHGIHRALLSYNFDPLEVTIGRDRLHYGPMDHSLLISDAVPFLDQLRLTLPMGDWRLDYALVSPETRSGRDSYYHRSTYFVFHRLEWRSEALTLAYVEQAFLDRNEYDPNTGALVALGTYALTDFLPVMLYHQADLKPFNTSMALDAQWRVSPTWTVSGQLGSDDFDAKLFGIPDNSVPNIWGFIVGSRVTGSDPASDQSWVWYTEVGGTHYLWGNFEDDSPGAKAVYRIFLDNGVQTLPMTSSYGPGAFWVNLDLTWRRGPFEVESRSEVWSTFDGVDLNLPYYDPAPSWSSLTGHGRFQTLFRWSDGPWTLATGPGLLVSEQTWTPQWFFQVKNRVGVTAPTRR